MFLPFAAVLALCILSAHGAPTECPCDDKEVIKSEYEYGDETCSEDCYHVETPDSESCGSSDSHYENEGEGCMSVVTDHATGTVEGNSEDQSSSKYSTDYCNSHEDKNGEYGSSGSNLNENERKDKIWIKSTPDCIEGTRDSSSKYHDHSEGENYSDDVNGKTRGKNYYHSAGESEGSSAVFIDKDKEITASKQCDHGESKGVYKYTTINNDGCPTEGSNTNKSTYKRHGSTSTYKGKVPACDDH